jgi:hypothetical protein
MRRKPTRQHFGPKLMPFLTQFVVFPIFGPVVSVANNIIIGSIFTAVSIVRSFALRCRNRGRLPPTRDNVWPRLDSRPLATQRAVYLHRVKRTVMEPLADMASERGDVRF